MNANSCGLQVSTVSAASCDELRAAASDHQRCPPHPRGCCPPPIVQGSRRFSHTLPLSWKEAASELQSPHRGHSPGSKAEVRRAQGAQYVRRWKCHVETVYLPNASKSEPMLCIPSGETQLGKNDGSVFPNRPAKLKSIKTMRPPLSFITLLGLKSPWQKPAEWS